MDPRRSILCHRFPSRWAIGFALVLGVSEVAASAALSPAAWAAVRPDPWFEPAFARPDRLAATFTGVQTITPLSPLPDVVQPAARLEASDPGSFPH